ncbi:MAG: bifunctional 4-hydroxy-2-oxoglutarate aldolase/2-dehydro-3-deoxy-phosphogluconate aldolase [Promethearchaeota archaeon]
MSIFKTMEKYGVVPVAVIEDLKNATNLSKTLLDAGLPILEITFRTRAAEKSIRLISEKFPEILLGAGTVLKIEQVSDAIKSGAQFIVTPGFNPKIVDYCLSKEIMIIPGLNSPTFVEWALERGLKVVKFFPAEVSGGISMLKALSGPYPDMSFIPTGGINENNLVSYLKLKNVIACGGSWLVKKDLISSGNFTEIRNRVEHALELVANAKV